MLIDAKPVSLARINNCEIARWIYDKLQYQLTSFLPGTIVVSSKH